MSENRSSGFPPPPPLPDPTPLPSARTLPPFPVDALPDWAREWVAAEAVATQTPSDLAGCCVLGVLAAAVGGRAVVQPRRGWREPVNLFLCPVMPPGSRKSAVIAAATAPLYAAEEDLMARVRSTAAEALMTKEIAVKAAQKAAQQAANASDAATRVRLTSEAVSAQADADAIEVPAPPRLIADDVTPEAVGSLLAAHGGRLAIISAEGGVFDVLGGRYSGGVPSLDTFLKGHAGDPLRVDRKGRASEYVKAPALTMLLTVQPVVLSGVARNSAFRGRGLTARFGFSLPPDIVGRRKINPATMTEAVAWGYDQRVRELVAECADWTDPAVLPLTPEAHALLLGLESVIEPRLGRDAEYGPIREWASKLAGMVVRFAALLHVAEGGEAFRRPITEETLGRAIELGGYFACHAAAAFDLLGDGGTNNADYVLRFLRRKGWKEFSIRELLTDLPRGRFSSTEDVNATVEILVDHGWVLPMASPPRSGPGRAPSPRYQPHPLLLAEMDPFDPANTSAESAEFAQPPALLSLARAVAPEYVSAQSAEYAEPTTAGRGSADSADTAEASDDRSCRRCGRTSMHPLDADALCVERCAKPPTPQQRRTGPQRGRICIRCQLQSAQPLITPGLCRDCAYPSEPPDAA